MTKFAVPRLERILIVPVGMENVKKAANLRRDLSYIALWEVLLLAFILITFFGFLDRTSDKKYEFSRTSYQTKVDLYDLRIEDNSKSINDRVETGL